MEVQITLTWCKKHKNWWVTNCPDCMVDSNEPAIRKSAMLDGGRIMTKYWLKEWSALKAMALLNIDDIEFKELIRR